MKLIDTRIAIKCIIFKMGSIGSCGSWPKIQQRNIKSKVPSKVFLFSKVDYFQSIGRYMNGKKLCKNPSSNA